MRINTICAFLIAYQFSMGQNLGAYSDYRNYFYVFDNGVHNQAEFMPIKTSKTGGNSVAYIDNSDNFKVFYNGKAYLLADIPPSNFMATDNIVAYYKDKILSVFDNGNAMRLPGWAINYIVGDSIAGFFDENSGYYKIYYKGEVIVLPDALDMNSMTSFSAGDNTIAYRTSAGRLKAFYHGKFYDLGTNNTTAYKAGAGLVAFMDDYSQSFKVFYDGIIATLENLAPRSMQVGDNLIAYVDAGGNFKIFYKGDVYTISTVEPEFYSVTDNVVVFGTENINFSVFYKGKIYLLEKNTPTEYKKDFNSVAYIDRYGYLKLFCDGQTTQVSNIRINSYTLTNNVLMYRTGLNDIHFYMNGKTY